MEMTKVRCRTGSLEILKMPCSVYATVRCRTGSLRALILKTMLEILTSKGYFLNRNARFHWDMSEDDKNYGINMR